MSGGVDGASLAVQAACVAFGAAAGALLRWGVALALNPMWGGFPIGTLVINMSGGLVIGIAAATLVQPTDHLWRLLLMTGLCGGFTTFSAFSLESLVLLQRGAFAMALAHTGAHVLGSLACAALGWAAAHAVLGALR